MSAARCPQCGATLRGTVEWCSQCYADLRPPAPPPPPPAAPAPVSVPLPSPPLQTLVAGPLDTPLAQATAAAMADPLTAPIGYVDGSRAAAEAVQSAVAASGATPAVPQAVEGWPCIRCGTVNEMDRMACRACGVAFGAELADSIRVPGTRQGRLVLAVVGVISVLAMLAALVYATTPDAKPKDSEPKPISTQPITPLVEE